MTAEVTSNRFQPNTNALRVLLDAARDELGWASTRTADPAIADDARPTTCPTCLTDLDPEGFCSCCGRVFT